MFSLAPKIAALSSGSRVVGSAGPQLVVNMSKSMDRIGQRPYHDSGKQDICPNMVRGIDYIRDPRLNKGMSFTLEERQTLGLHGLIPPRFKTQDEQVSLCKTNLDRYQDPLNKYIYLAGLQDRNERLFFRLLSENVEEYMPLVYTPIVGLACQKFGAIFRRPRGLWISIHDKGHVYDVLRNWPETDVRAICVTDGERILGLGDLGAQGMGIPVGKLSLYTALAGIKPQQCLPIVLDVGTNRKELLEDEFYIGCRHERVTGQAYDDFVEEFMQAVVQRYGQNTLIQFEDFGNHNAFRFLEKYRDSYCTFNDDIQGTASVAVAGILSALRITNNKLSDHKILFQGAGEANIGIANLCTMAMVEEGMTLEAARANIYMVDSRGLIVKNRPKGGVTGHKVDFAKELAPIDALGDIVKAIKPTAIVGAAAQPGVFTEELVKDMAAYNERPIIFALSNPTSKAECTAEQAYTWSEGRCIFASGSPFDPVTLNGKTFYPGQGNNAYIFPGVALGIICSGVHHVPDKMFLESSRALAEMVTQADLDEGRLYPPLEKIQECSTKIATFICETAYKQGVASTYPEPEDKRAFIESQLYDFKYDNDTALPTTWAWPDLASFNPKL